MTLAAVFLYLSLTLPASATPLQLLTPQIISTTTLDPTNNLPLNATANCFIQPHYPGAPTLLETNYADCLVAVTMLLADKTVTTPYTFGRRPDADVRLPYAKSFRTCKIMIDIMDDFEMERLRWRDISDTLEAPRGVLNKCLGQGRLPPLGGRTSVGEKAAMQAIVVGQVWRSGAVV